MESNSTQLYFSTDENDAGFAISLSLKTSQLFMRSTDWNWDGQNPIGYEKWSNNWFAPVLIS